MSARDGKALCACLKPWSSQLLEVDPGWEKRGGRGILSAVGKAQVTRIYLFDFEPQMEILDRD